MGSRPRYAGLRIGDGRSGGTFWLVARVGWASFGKF